MRAVAHQYKITNAGSGSTTPNSSSETLTKPKLRTIIKKNLSHLKISKPSVAVTERGTKTMLLHPTPIRPSFPLARHPSPLSPPFLPLRSSVSFIPSALSRRSRSPLNRRRQSDGGDGDDAAWNLEDDEIDDYDEASEERKPRGFVAGGIRYDTSLEEKLLKEIQRNRKDQTENLNKDKDHKVKVKRESQSPKKKGAKVKKPQDKTSNTAPNKTG